MTLTTYFKAGTFFADSDTPFPVQLVILPVSGDLPDASGRSEQPRPKYDGGLLLLGRPGRIDVEGLDITLARETYWDRREPVRRRRTTRDSLPVVILQHGGAFGRVADPGGGFAFGTDAGSHDHGQRKLTEGNLHIEGTL